jgi:hypothetical protein
MAWPNSDVRSWINLRGGISLLTRVAVISVAGLLEKHWLAASSTREWLCEGKVEERKI